MMKKEKVKVYTYTRVSTAMQIDGYSLDAQKSRMKAYAEFNDYEIVGEYEDAGKSGKSIEGRVEFNRMMEDIKSGKDGVSYVLVFKLSRFGRNAADVLSTLQVMQDFGVNLICVEDGIDSSKDAGKLMISVLSAVAEIERENIRVQTMEGRIQKAREGKWNGGFAPYGYKLEKGQLFINEEEAAAIRVIFDQYVHTDTGANGLAKYLATHGIHKIQRQNGKNPLFDAALIRRILKNPVYCGKIAYGRRRTEKVHGTRNDYRLVEQDDYLLVDGLHEGIVSEELWHEAQVKLLAQAEKYEHVNRGKDTKIHLLSGIVKCPICGVGMYGNKSIKHKADGSKYKDFYYYGCKHRTMTHGHKCDFKKQINEELLDSAVAEVIVKLVSNPKFAAMMQEKISMKVDTSSIEQEIAAHEKQLRQSYSVKARLMDEIDSLDPDDKHYIKRKADLDDRLYKMYDKIEDTENQLVAARAKKMAIEAEKLTGDNIYKVLIFFDKLYSVMDDQEKRQLMETLLSEVQIYEERQPNGQWLKSIKFKLPIIAEDMSLSLDNDAHIEAVGLHNGGQAVKVVLICHTPPGAQTRGGIGAGHDDAAGGTLAVIVVGGQAHIDLVIEHQQAVNAIGHALGIVGVVIGDAAFIGFGVHLDEGGGGAAHAGKIDLALELKGHAIAGQIVHALEIRGIAGEDVGVILENVPLPEDHLGLAGVAVHSHDHGGPLGHGGFIEGVRAEHDLHKICRGPAGVHVLVQLALLLHGVQGRLDVVVIDVVGGVIAGADVNVVTGLSHGPGVALAPVLQIAGQNAVHLSGTQRGVGDLVNGVAALGVNTLLQGLVADGVVVIADDGCQCAVDQADRHNQGQQNSGAGFERFVHVIPLLKKQFACPCTKNTLSIMCAPTATQYPNIIRILLQ